MGFLNKIIEHRLEKIGFVKKEEVENNSKYFNRAFEAAKHDRLTSSWIAESNSIEAEIQQDKNRLMGRAKDLVQNNDYAKAWLRRTVKNVIGPNGFILQNKAKDSSGKFDKKTNDIIEAAFAEWSKAEFCTMRKNLTFDLLCRLLWKYLKVYGEFFVREIRPISTKRNKFGYSLELIEASDVDHTYTEKLKNGNVVVMGVEFNQWREPQAYYIRERTALTENIQGYYQKKKLIRVPANEIIHGYDPDFIKQSRGYSDLAPSIQRLHGVKGWEEASIVNARASATKLGFLEKPVIDAGEYKGDEQDEQGNELVDYSPGTIEKLPYGVKFNGWDPAFPHQQHGPFLETQLRAFATGQGMNYNLIAGDLKGATYSALKAGRIDENDTWAMDQNLFKDIFLKRIFAGFLKYGLMTGEIPLPFAKFDELNKPDFKGRSWKQLEPYKEANANKLKREMGWIDDFAIAAEQGVDLEDVYRKIKEAKELEKYYGLNFNADKKATPIEDDNTSEDDEDEATEKGKERSKLKIIGALE